MRNMSVKSGCDSGCVFLSVSSAPFDISESVVDNICCDKMLLRGEKKEEKKVRIGCCADCFPAACVSDSGQQESL